LHPELSPRVSCLYTGSVRHRRHEPVRHDFRYGLCLAFLDLDELPHLSGLAPLWGYEKRAPISFRRPDYLGDPRVPLDQAVRDVVERRTGARPLGAIRLLTCPRLFGYCFNPVSFYFCYGADPAEIDCVVAEVTNTPWLERHCYVLPIPAHRRRERVHSFVTPKELHVSPFMDMRQDYHWRVTTPGDRVAVHIGNRQSGRRLFDASMTLRRESLTRASLARSLVVPPLTAVRITAAIYFEALRLWVKGAPFFPHPRYRPETQAPESPAPKSGHETAPKEVQSYDERHRAA
jgi:DUF1365 family protein